MKNHVINAKAIFPPYLKITLHCHLINHKPISEAAMDFEELADLESCCRVCAKAISAVDMREAFRGIEPGSVLAENLKKHLDIEVKYQH